MKKIIALFMVICCLMALGCGSKKQDKVASNETETKQNISEKEARCQEILNAYLAQQLLFDNGKIRDLNSHIVSIQDIADKNFRDVFLHNKQTKDDSIEELILDITTDKEKMRDYICRNFLTRIVARGECDATSYQKFFTVSNGEEIADLYVKLFSLTKYDIETYDNRKNKEEYVKAFKNFVKKVEPEELYFFKVSVEYVDFEKINNQIAERIIDEFIKDPKIILTNERIKNGKTAAPTTLDKLFDIINLNKEGGTDREYMVAKMKEIFISVLKENEKNPPTVNDDFYNCMLSVPILEHGQQYYFVSEIYDTINKPSEEYDGLSVRKSDTTTVKESSIFKNLDAHIWSGFIGNISKNHSNTQHFKAPKKRVNYSDPTISILDIQPVDNSNKEYKYYKLKIKIQNNTNQAMMFHSFMGESSKFSVTNEYDDTVTSTKNETPMEWQYKDEKGMFHRAEFSKEDFDRYTDDELSVLVGQKPIPPHKFFEITQILSISKKDIELGKLWLAYDGQEIPLKLK